MADMLAEFRADRSPAGAGNASTPSLPSARLLRRRNLHRAADRRRHHDMAGSSCGRVRTPGFLTYSNEAKQDMLGVRPATLEGFGAVSARSPRKWCSAHGPPLPAQFAFRSPVSPPRRRRRRKSPVGLVWIGLSGPDDLTSAVELRWEVFLESRPDRASTVRAATGRPESAGPPSLTEASGSRPVSATVAFVAVDGLGPLLRMLPRTSEGAINKSSPKSACQHRAL